MNDRAEAVDAGLDFLVATQQSSGEIPSYARFLDDQNAAWEPDSLKFITALVALALQAIDDERARRIAAAAVGFLRAESEGPDLWRYWSRSHERHSFTPPDADDTACSSMALNGAGIPTTANRRVLLANRDDRGRFYTWIVPHRPWPRDPRVWWALRAERNASDARRELWESTEATYDDIDGVVNANVIRYLGARAPRESVDSVIAILEAGQELDCDSWHRSPFNLYAAVGDGARRGVVGFSDVQPLVLERIAGRQRADGSVGHALDTALAANAVLDLGGQATALDGLRAALLRAQGPDGAWSRDVYYFGGPSEVFGWGSEALTTALAIRSLVG